MNDCSKRERKSRQNQSKQNEAVIASFNRDAASGDDFKRLPATLLNTIEQAIIATDLDGAVIYWNKFAEQLYGWSSKEVLGRNIVELVALAPDLKEVKEIMLRLRRGKSWTGEFTVKRKNGSTFPAQIITSPVYDKNKTLIGFVGLSIDVTARKLKEQTLRESENKYRTLIEQAADGIHTYDLTGNFIETNSKLCEMLGYTAEELLRLNIEDLVPPEELIVNPIRFDELNAGKTVLNERWLRRKDGTLISVEVSGKMVQPGVLQAIIRDITERKRIEERLKQSEERLRSIFEASHDGILVEEDEKIIYINNSYIQMFGYEKPEELIGRHISVIIASEDAERVLEYGKARLRDEQPSMKYEFKGKKKDGTLIDVEASVSTSKSVNKTYITTIIRDISERKRMAALIEAQKQSLEMVVKGAPLPEVLAYLTQIVEQQTDGMTVASILLLDEHGHLHNGASPSLPESYIQAIKGIKADENLGTCGAAAASRKIIITPDIAADPKWRELAHLPLELGFKAAWSMPIFSGSENVSGIFGTYFRECREPTDSERRIVEILARTAALAIERKQAEEILLGNEKQLRLIIDANPLLISYIDKEHRYRFINKTYTEWFRQVPEEVVGRHLSEILGQSAYQTILPEIEKALSGEEVGFERLVPYENGERYIYANYVPDVDASTGQIVGFYAFVQDISERKQSEEALRRSREELEFRVQERTLELAAANNALQMQIIERWEAEESRVKALQRLVTAQEDERRRLARDLHDQLGQQLTALRLKLEVLKKMCGGSSKELYNQISETQKIAWQLDTDVDFLARQIRPTVLDDLGIAAALDNYAREWSITFNIQTDFNAERFGKIALSPEAETNLYHIAQEALNNVSKHARASKVNILLERRDNFAVLIVEDNGIGFDSDKQIHQGRGVKGLGLIGMYERVTLVGGTLEIESAPDSGTTIYARVPVLSAGEKCYE